MTFYTIHRAGASEPDPEQHFYCHQQTFIAGACRAVLDFARLNGEDPVVRAEWYHTGDNGWEADAIGDGRPELLNRLSVFVEAHAPAIGTVAVDIAHNDYRPSYVPYGDVDAAWYHAGYLYVLSANGDGYGLWEYAERTGRALSDAASDGGVIAAYAYRDEPVVELVEV